MVDTLDLGSSAVTGVGVRVPSLARLRIINSKNTNSYIFTVVQFGLFFQAKHEYLNDLF
jgi:hypothetical protein